MCCHLRPIRYVTISASLIFILGNTVCVHSFYYLLLEEAVCFDKKNWLLNSLNNSEISSSARLKEVHLTKADCMLWLPYSNRRLHLDRWKPFTALCRVWKRYYHVCVYTPCTFVAHDRDFLLQLTMWARGHSVIFYVF